MTTDTCFPGWTDGTITRLRALWAEGLSTAEIGRRLGTTKNAIVGKAHRLDLPSRPCPVKREACDPRAPRNDVRYVPPPKLSDLVPLKSLSAPLPADRPARSSAQARSTPRPVPGWDAAFAPAPVPSRIGNGPCCWPLGEPGTKSFRYCGEPAAAREPYCPVHRATAWIKPRGCREDPMSLVAWPGIRAMEPRPMNGLFRALRGLDGDV